MTLIDDHHLLNANQTQLLDQNVKKQFSFGGYNSLDDILTQLNVDVIIEKGVLYHSVHKSLNDAEEIWMILKELEEQADNKKRLNCEVSKTARNTYKKIESEKVSLSQMPLRGLYDPGRNYIKLYPDEMMKEYKGMRMDELLVSTLAHETMHAYFNRPGHDKFPYVYLVEEPLAEFGMLFYLHKIGSSYYKWAHTDVNSKDTCYRYGATLIDQALNNPSSTSYYDYLQEYKIMLPISCMLEVSDSGASIMPITKRDIIKTAFDLLYEDLGYDLTDYLQTNLGYGTMTRMPSTTINAWKWAPTGSRRATLLEIKRADYPRLSAGKKIDRYFKYTYEASNHPDSYFLLSNQWGGGDNSFNKIIDGFCKSVNTMAAKNGRPDYFSKEAITILKMPVKSLTPKKA